MTIDSWREVTERHPSQDFRCFRFQSPNAQLFHPGCKQRSKRNVFTTRTFSFRNATNSHLPPYLLELRKALMEETEAILPSYVQNYENFHPNGGLCFRASELNLDQQRRSCTEGAFAWAGPIIAQLDKNEPITDLHSCERRVNEKPFHVQSEAKIGLCPGIETSISENIPHVSASRMAQRDEFQRKYYHFVRLLRQKSYVCSTVVVFQKINRFS